MNKCEQLAKEAYDGAREDLAIWKKRALEDEEKVRIFDQRIVDIGVIAMTPITTPQPDRVAELEATNKKLLDALNSICGTKTSAGWLGEIDDTLFSMLEGEGYGKVSREINRAKAEGLQAIAEAEGKEG